MMRQDGANRRTGERNDHASPPPAPHHEYRDGDAGADRGMHPRLTRQGADARRTAQSRTQAANEALEGVVAVLHVPDAGGRGERHGHRSSREADASQ